MNIEEEREAFEAMIVSRDLGGAEFVKRCRDGNSYRPGLYLDMFKGWLAAKEHAAEMSRIPCELWEALSSEWRVLTPGTLNDVSDMQAKFDTEHDALEWIKANNYRVI